MKTNLAAFLLALSLIGSAHADPVTALSCTSLKAKTFATIGVMTAPFPNSAQQILQYDVKLGKLQENGQPESKTTRYLQESNMKIFDTNENATQWVKTNTVVVPLWSDSLKNTPYTILVNLAKMKITLIDNVYETIDEIDCIVN